MSARVGSSCDNLLVLLLRLRELELPPVGVAQVHPRGEQARARRSPPAPAPSPRRRSPRCRPASRRSCCGPRRSPGGARRPVLNALQGGGPLLEPEVAPCPARCGSPGPSGPRLARSPAPGGRARTCPGGSRPGRGAASRARCCSSALRIFFDSASASASRLVSSSTQVSAFRAPRSSGCCWTAPRRSCSASPARFVRTSSRARKSHDSGGSGVQLRCAAVARLRLLQVALPLGDDSQVHPGRAGVGVPVDDGLEGPPRRRRGRRPGPARHRGRWRLACRSRSLRPGRPSPRPPSPPGSAAVEVVSGRGGGAAT